MSFEALQPTSAFTGSLAQTPIIRPLIVEAIEEASAVINSHLGTEDIRLELVGDDGNKAAVDFNEQWDENTYNWNKITSSAAQKMATVKDDDNLYGFTLALYKGSKLLGFCRYDIRDRNLNIDSVEGLQDKTQNPLLGLTIAIFSQASLEVAKRANLSGIMVGNHDIVHFNAYRRTGYGSDGSNPNNQLLEKHVMPITVDSQINWRAVVNRYIERSADRIASSEATIPLRHSLT